MSRESKRSCGPGQITRRAFLRTAGAGALGLGMWLGDKNARVSASTTEGQPLRAAGKPRVHLGFVRFPERTRKGWPGFDYDVEAHQREFTRKLHTWAQELGMELSVHSEPLQEKETVNRFLDRVRGEPGEGTVLVVLTRYLWGVIGQITDAVQPLVVFAPIGTSFAPQALGVADKPGVFLASTLDEQALRYGLRMFKAAWQLRHSRVLVIAGKAETDRSVDKWGTQLHYIPWRRYPETLEQVKVTPEVEQLADFYLRKAQKVVEPSREEVLTAARIYVACKHLLTEAQAQAITMDCLPHRPGRTTPPPCIAWSKFNDEGIPAGCEADLYPTLTLMLIRFLFDRPGYMGNPVAETEKDWLLIAHCTSALRLRGRDEPGIQFLLRSHAESGKGAVIQALWPEGEEVTVARLLNPRQMLLGSGRVVANLPHPPAGGCRTTIALALDVPPDLRQLRNFHHPVVFLGNQVKRLRAFCQLYGVEVVPLAKG
ncbi:MAG TPA: hypothetical protein EYP85_12840 [Armatimonadetes bacterium]|nr:hypothetical protein [Armatimonadota bacterium]